MPTYILMAYLLHGLSAPVWCWIVYGVAYSLWALCAFARLFGKKKCTCSI